MKKVISNTVVFLITFIALYGATEFAFRMYTKSTIIYDIEMHKYAKSLKQRSSYPGLSHEHVANSQAHLMGVDCKINNVGFRDEPLAEVKPANIKRIFVVGSSITFGWGIPYDSVFTQRLEKQLNHVPSDTVIEVVNSGIGNYNTVLEAILFKRNVDRVNPDRVILHYFINDAEVISPKSANWLIANSYFTAYMYVRVKQMLATSSKGGSIGTYYKSLYQADNKGWQAAQQAILEIKQACDSKVIPFTLLIQPDLHDLKESGDLYDCYRVITDFADNNKVPYLNLFPAYAREFGADDPRNIWVHPDDSHPNIAGHRVIFEQLYHYLAGQRETIIN